MRGGACTQHSTPRSNWFPSLSQTAKDKEPKACIAQWKITLASMVRYHFPYNYPVSWMDSSLSPPLGESAGSNRHPTDLQFGTDIQLIYNSRQPCWHTWESISHRAFLSCCLFLMQVSIALTGDIWIPVVALVLAIVSQCISVTTHMPKFKRKLMCTGGEATALVPGGKCN